MFMMSRATFYRAATHVLAVMHLTITMLVLLVIVTPYLAHGMYHYTFAGDPEQIRTPFILDYFPYNQRAVGEAIYEIAASLYVGVMLFFPLSTILWIGCLWVNRHYSPPASRQMRAALVLALGLTCLVWTPPGLNILDWLIID